MTSVSFDDPRHQRRALAPAVGAADAPEVPKIKMQDVRCPECSKLIMRIFVGDHFSAWCHRCRIEVTEANAKSGIRPPGGGM